MMWRMFAHEEDGLFSHIYGNRASVGLCGDDPIVAVSVEEVPDGHQTHWGWLDAHHEGPSLIWPSRVQLEMCFTYGMQAEIDRGRGRPVCLRIERNPTDSEPTPEEKP